MRRFEHTDGRWWSIGPIGTRELEIRWGTYGKPGQVVMRRFETDAEANAKLKTEVARMLAFRFAEVGPVPAPTPAPVPEVEWSLRLETAVQFIELSRIGPIVRQTRGRKPNIQPKSQRYTHETLESAEATISQLIANATSQGFKVLDDELELEPLHDDNDDDEDEDDDGDTAELASSPALEAECRAALDDPGPWSIYADWLLDQNDPRGELAALCATNPATSQVKELMRVHRMILYGDDTIGRMTKITRYRHGFPAAITVPTKQDSSYPLAEWVRMLVARPFLQFVEELHLGLASFESDNDWEPTLRTIAKSRLAPHLTALHFDEFDRDEQEMSWVPFGDLSWAWPHFPSLRELVIKSGMGGTLGAIDLPMLKSFVRISGGLSLDEITSIREANWPELERLEIWFGAANYGAEGNAETIAPILTSSRTPALHHLGIVNCEFLDAALPALARSPLLRRLRSLDLSLGTLSSATRLVSLAPSFVHLDKLDLGGNLLSDRDVRSIRLALPNATLDNQRDGSEGHYVAVGE